MQENERKEQQAQDISEEMISQENISQEIGEKEPAEDTQEQGLLNITFIPKYMDIFDGLCATDQADGTGKRARMLFVVLVLLMCVQLVGFSLHKTALCLCLHCCWAVSHCLLRKKPAL